MVYQVKIQNMDHLKERIRDACALTPDVLKRVCHERERRIRICYQCNVVHISMFCKLRDRFPHVWRLLNHPVDAVHAFVGLCLKC
jgi:hypothetical protein